MIFIDTRPEIFLLNKHLQVSVGACVVSDDLVVSCAVAVSSADAVSRAVVIPSAFEVSNAFVVSDSVIVGWDLFRFKGTTTATVTTIIIKAA